MADGHAIFAIIIAILAVIVFMLYYFIRSKLNKINKGKVYTILYFSILVILLVALVIPLVGFIIQKVELEKKRHDNCVKGDQEFREVARPLILSSEAKLMNGLEKSFKVFQSIARQLRTIADRSSENVEKEIGLFDFKIKNEQFQTKITNCEKKFFEFEGAITELETSHEQSSDCGKKIREQADVLRPKDALNSIKTLFKELHEKFKNITTQVDIINTNMKAGNVEYVARVNIPKENIETNFAALQNRFNESLNLLESTKINEIPTGFNWVDFTIQMFYVSFAIFVVLSVLYIIAVIITKFLAKKENKEKKKNSENIAEGTSGISPHDTPRNTAGASPEDTSKVCPNGTTKSISVATSEVQTPLEKPSSVADTLLFVARCLKLLALIIICAAFAGISYSGLLQSIDTCSKSAKTSLLSSYTIQFINTDSENVTKTIDSLCPSSSDTYFSGLSLDNSITVESIMQKIGVNEYIAKMNSFWVSENLKPVDIPKEITDELAKIMKLVRVLEDLFQMKCINNELMNYKIEYEELVDHWQNYVDHAGKFKGIITKFESIMKPFFDKFFENIRTQIESLVIQLTNNIKAADFGCKPIFEFISKSSASQVYNLSFWFCCMFGIFLLSIIIQYLPSPWLKEKEPVPKKPESKNKPIEEAIFDKNGELLNWRDYELRYKNEINGNMHLCPEIDQRRIQKWHRGKITKYVIRDREAGQELPKEKSKKTEREKENSNED